MTKRLSALVVARNEEDQLADCLATLAFADEIVVVLGCADGGRLHPRIGNRYIDLEELAAEKAQ